MDPLGLDFTNSSSKTLCVMKDTVWRKIPPGVKLIGDVDAVAAPKGQIFNEPPKSHRVYKWIDCYNGIARDARGGFISIGIVRRTSDELSDLPITRETWCRCMSYESWLKKQRETGGPVSDFGDPPADCP